MATPLDTSLLQHFGGIFPFLLIFALVYGIFSSIKPFGDTKAIYAIIAVVAAGMAMFSTVARETINIMAPWFVLLFFLILFTMVAVMMFGYKTEDIMATLSSPKNSYIIVWVVAFGLIIGFGSLTTVLSKQGGVGVEKGNTTAEITNATGSGTQQTAFWAAITHPKVLGMILIMLIAVFSISKLTQND